MAENSKIEWTRHTFNPWFGCTKVSEGCAHCYAEKSSPANVARAKGHETWGKGAQRIRTSAENWTQPLKWNREAAATRLFEGYAFRQWGTSEIAGQPGTLQILAQCPDMADLKFTPSQWDALPRYRPRVFCASLADWLDDEVPIEWLAELMELIMRTPHLDWLLLTKRPQNWERRITDALAEVERIKGDWPDRDPETQTGMMLNEWMGGNAPANVWIGTTVENQARADERIPQLLSIPAKVRFLSCEPLLGPVNLAATFHWQRNEMARQPVWTPENPGIHWVIAGGESGPHARPMHPDWARSLRDQCSAAGVPFFFKQWGEYDPATITVDGDEYEFPDGQLMRRWGKKKAGRLLDGRLHDEFPQVERGTAA